MRNLTLTNVAAAPSFNVVAVGTKLVRINASDGQGGEITLTVPRSNAQAMANALNGTANGQIRSELEDAERAGTLTESQARKLTRIREAAERIAQLNAQRAADKAAREATGNGKASKGRGGNKAAPASQEVAFA